MNREELAARLRRSLSANVMLDVTAERTLLCHLPEVGEQAFLHTVFSGISRHQVIGAANANQLEIPESFVSMLESFNGAILFKGSLSLFGIVQSFTRNPAVRQPFDFLNGNKFGRPLAAQSSDFFIGGMSWDGSLLFLEGDSPTVLRRSRESRNVINTWPSIEVLLEERIAELEKLFDEHGRKIDKKAPTAPLAMQTRVH